jgi:hypothetical protein
VSGIISGDLKKLRNVALEPEFRSLVRIASRHDSPFERPSFGYGLTIQTGDKAWAGTNADITFTLKGKLGSASKTVDGSRGERFERNSPTFVALPSDDLGELLSLTVQRDDEGLGTDWYVEDIVVESNSYGTKRRAIFQMWLDSTAPVSRRLR